MCESVNCSVVKVSDLLSPTSINFSVAILICVCLVTAMGNVMFLVTVWHTKRMRRTLYILLTNFFITDLVFVGISLPLNIATFLADGPPFGYVVCYLKTYITYGTISTSACVLTSVAVYRLLQVCYNHIYIRVISRKWLLSVSICLWVTPVAFCAGFGGSVTYDPQRYSCAYTNISLTYILVCCLYLPLIFTVVFCYVKIYLFTKKSRQRVEVHSIQHQTNMGAPSTSSKKRDDVVFKMMLVVFMEILFFYVIPGVLNSLINIVPSASKPRVTLAAFHLFRIRPCVNVITCILTNMELRMTLRDCFGCARGHSINSES
ncbi:melatonin receptor type 1A-like [Haliotis rubra]|uniref:melatonin receptor type 1A-like n=1 Tax=Haliotis rubra TaxID=36100 RepID=UPI001EE595B4|nr:melatonin receptor type 1A-like [Haliotis rubra]